MCGTSNSSTRTHKHTHTYAHAHTHAIQSHDFKKQHPVTHTHSNAPPSHPPTLSPFHHPSLPPSLLVFALCLSPSLALPQETDQHTLVNSLAVLLLPQLGQVSLALVDVGPPAAADCLFAWCIRPTVCLHRDSGGSVGVERLQCSFNELFE